MLKSVGPMSPKIRKNQSFYSYKKMHSLVSHELYFARECSLIEFMYLWVAWSFAKQTSQPMQLVTRRQPSQLMFFLAFVNTRIFATKYKNLAFFPETFKSKGQCDSGKAVFFGVGRFWGQRRKEILPILGGREREVVIIIRGSLLSSEFLYTLIPHNRNFPSTPRSPTFSLSQNHRLIRFSSGKEWE